MESENDSVTMCVDCEDAPVELQCEQCQDVYCKVCFVALHRKGKRAGHVGMLPTGARVLPHRVAEAAAAAVAAERPPRARDDGSADQSDGSEDDGGSSRMPKSAVPRDLSTLLDRSWLEQAKFMPLRLGFVERKYLRLLEATLFVADYTGAVDTEALAKSRPQRLHKQLLEITAILSGIVFIRDYEKGQGVLADRDFTRDEKWFQAVFELGRRYKIMNSDKLRSEYGKMMYLLQDAMQPDVRDGLGISMVKPIKTVHWLLASSKDGLALLQDADIEQATRALTWDRRTQSRGHYDQERDLKERARKRLIRRYSGGGLTDEEVELCLYSIGEHRSYLLDNVVPVQSMLDMMEQFFAPDHIEADDPMDHASDGDGTAGNDGVSARTRSASAGKNAAAATGTTANGAAVVVTEADIDGLVNGPVQPADGARDRFSLAIRAGGADGARLTHSHERQYYYVLQSLSLWREILRRMFELWCLADQDLLDTDASPYRLEDTGQGWHRVQASPRVARAMRGILHRVQSSVQVWVGSSVVHLGDHNVPNSLMFIDKYTQVSRILSPIVRTLDGLDRLCADYNQVEPWIIRTFGSVDLLRKEILADFFRSGFDGSGADNFFDAGSCIDGRLTSAWNWCSKLPDKRFFRVFQLAGFTGFDGEYAK